jgi:hypothetical protein
LPEALPDHDEAAADRGDVGIGLEVRRVAVDAELAAGGWPPDV